MYVVKISIETHRILYKNSRTYCQRSKDYLDIHIATCVSV